ncbi:gp295 [Bacillus phage G]|uniref:Gp295 n=1 Tax=Bacillus phage G TaxID=2884420 RepID=G3MA36_9CAUD|nr:gp295 [Bacillus phage G]AEO93554.1 gp295 [Bacillus phage G]
MMNKKDIVAFTALLNSLIEMNVDISQHIPKDKQDRFIQLFEKRHPQLMKNSNMKEAMIKELEKYIKMIK